MIIKTEKITPAIAAPLGAAREPRDVDLLSTIFSSDGSDALGDSSESSSGPISARPRKEAICSRTGERHSPHFLGLLPKDSEAPRDAQISLFEV
jgi:hypothetical protein